MQAPVMPTPPGSSASLDLQDRRRVRTRQAPRALRPPGYQGSPKPQGEHEVLRSLEAQVRQGCPVSQASLPLLEVLLLQALSRRGSPPSREVVPRREALPQEAPAVVRPPRVGLVQARVGAPHRGAPGSQSAWVGCCRGRAPAGAGGSGRGYPTREGIPRRLRRRPEARGRSGSVPRRLAISWHRPRRAWGPSPEGRSQRSAARSRRWDKRSPRWRAGRTCSS